MLGKLVQRPAILDKKLARELKSLSNTSEDPYDTVIGKTMCTNDFYEGMGLLSKCAIEIILIFPISNNRSRSPGRCIL